MELATESNGKERYVTRKVINSTYISLDGAVEQPHLWPTIERPPDERGGQIQTDLLLACDAVLMGRRTYEGFAPVWQSRSGDPFSDRINTMPKYVVSTTLKDPDWANTTVISSDVAERIRDIKAEPGQDIVQYGFGSVSTLLMEHGLLDELRLWVHPLFVGAGSTEDLLFPKGPPTQFELVGSTILKSSMVILTYRLAS
jgi:dihydrofolate reductase